MRVVRPRIHQRNRSAHTLFRMKRPATMPATMGMSVCGDEVPKKSEIAAEDAGIGRPRGDELHQRRHRGDTERVEQREHDRPDDHAGNPALRIRPRESRAAVRAGGAAFRSPASRAIILRRCRSGTVSQQSFVISARECADAALGVPCGAAGELAGGSTDPTSPRPSPEPHRDSDAFFVELDERSERLADPVSARATMWSSRHFGFRRCPENRAVPVEHSQGARV